MYWAYHWICVRRLGQCFNKQVGYASAGKQCTSKSILNDEKWRPIHVLAYASAVYVHCTVGEKVNPTSWACSDDMRKSSTAPGENPCIRQFEHDEPDKAGSEVTSLAIPSAILSWSLNVHMKRTLNHLHNSTRAKLVHNSGNLESQSPVVLDEKDSSQNANYRYKS